MLKFIDDFEYFGDILFSEEARYLIADLKELVGYGFAVHLVICFDGDAIDVDGTAL